MEALKKLEEVQRMVSFVTSSGFASDDPDSNGFLAHFLLFLVQTSSMLDTEKRCHLISENLSKISPAFLEEARACITAEDSQQNFTMCPNLQLHPDNKREIFPLRTNEKDMAMIRLDSMQRANSTLEDFCRSYFMFHGMDVNEPQTLFRFLPVISFTESYIYQLDSFNEEILCSLMECSSLEKGPDFVDDTYRDEGNERFSNNILDAFKTDPLRPLVVLLEHHGLLTDRLRTELSSGTEYWSLERKLCHALISKKEIPIEDVMRAIHLKSFDYRVLNLLLYQLREQPVNDLHMEFLSISEFLVEVSDDFMTMVLINDKMDV